jgi:hypothetical protein
MACGQHFVEEPLQGMKITPSTSANINLHLCQCGVRCQIIVVKSPLRDMCASLMLLIEVSIPSLHVLMLIWSSDFHVKILTFERSYSRLFRLQLVLAEEIINRKCFARSKRKYRIRSGWKWVTAWQDIMPCQDDMCATRRCTRCRVWFVLPACSMLEHVTWQNLNRVHRT